MAQGPYLECNVCGRPAPSHGIIGYVAGEVVVGRLVARATTGGIFAPTPGVWTRFKDYLRRRAQQR